MKQFRADNVTNAGCFVPIPKAKPQLEDIYNVLEPGSKEKDSSSALSCVDSGTSSAGMQENHHHRRLTIPRGTGPNLSGLIETCNLGRNSLGYQLLVKNFSGGHPSALASNNTPSQKNLQCRNDGFQL